MLRRIASAISLNTIDAEAETYRDTLEADSDIDGATWNGGAQRIRLDGEDDAGVSETALCIRCQAFDVRSFARSASRRKGYLLRDVSAGAQSGCTFCTLLLDAVQDVERPEYFYTHAFRPGKTVTKPDLYVHMTVSESYGEETVCARAAGLRANRLLVELGDRFSGITNRSVHEICLAADAGGWIFHLVSRSNCLGWTNCRVQEVQQLGAVTYWAGILATMPRPIRTLIRPAAGSQRVSLTQSAMKPCPGRSRLMRIVRHCRHESLRWFEKAASNDSTSGRLLACTAHT
tara:strand:- start:15297 stop:16163 length:867 start_codon:yes stop_codon:yes gene_type:complete